MTRASTSDLKRFLAKSSSRELLLAIENWIASGKSKPLSADRRPSRPGISVLGNLDPALSSAWSKWRTGAALPGPRLLARIRDELQRTAAELETFDELVVNYLFSRRRKVGRQALLFIDMRKLENIPRLVGNEIAPFARTSKSRKRENGDVSEYLKERDPQAAINWRRWSMYGVPIGATGLRRIFDAVVADLPPAGANTVHRLMCYYLFSQSLLLRSRRRRSTSSGALSLGARIQELAEQLDFNISHLHSVEGSEAAIAKIRTHFISIERPEAAISAISDIGHAVLTSGELPFPVNDKRGKLIAIRAFRTTGWLAQRAGIKAGSLASAHRLESLWEATKLPSSYLFLNLQRANNLHVFDWPSQQEAHAAAGLISLGTPRSAVLNFDHAFALASAADEACINGYRLDEKPPYFTYSVRSCFEAALRASAPYEKSEEYRLIRYWFCARLLQEGRSREAKILISETTTLRKECKLLSLEGNDLLVNGMFARLANPNDEIYELLEARDRALNGGDLYRARQFVDIANGKILPSR